MSVEKWTKIAPIFLIRLLPNKVKSMSNSLYFVRTYYSESWIIFKIIPLCARFWENCENRCLVVKSPLFVSLFPRNGDVVLRMHLWRYVTTRFPANIERKTSMHLYNDVTSLCKFGALKSYLFLVLSRVPLTLQVVTIQKILVLVFDTKICRLYAFKVNVTFGLYYCCGASMFHKYII